MTGSERWYIVGTLDDLRWAEAFSAGSDGAWRTILNEAILPYNSREAAEAAWSRRDDPRETDRIVDGAAFDAIKAMVRAVRAME